MARKQSGPSLPSAKLWPMPSYLPQCQQNTLHVHWVLFCSYRNAAWVFMAHLHWHNSCDASWCLWPAGQEQVEKGWVPVTPVPTVPVSTSFSEQWWGPVMLCGGQWPSCAALPTINWPQGSTPHAQEAQRAVSAPGGHWAQMKPAGNGGGMKLLKSFKNLPRTHL